MALRGRFPALTPRDIVDYFQVIPDRHPGPAQHSFHIRDIRGMGVRTGVNQEKLYALGRNLEKVLGRPAHSFISTVRFGLGA